MAGLTRLELATFRVTGGRSNQLSYSPLYIFDKSFKELAAPYEACQGGLVLRSFNEGGSPG